MEAKTIEQKVADAVLQRGVKVTIGGREYTASPPSVATLILVSEAVSKLPPIKLDSENVVEESLAIAKDCRILGDIASILILGAQGINEELKAPEKPQKSLWGRLLRNRRTANEAKQPKNTKAELARRILEEMTPSQLHLLVAQLLKSMELGDFFALTTFLTEINLLRKTKVERETTAFGQSSQG